jgi:hypothetical protein
MTKLNIDDHIIEQREYFEQLIQEFPDLEIDYEDLENGMVHFNMERFADYTISQIKKSDLNKLKSCFYFQEKRINYLSHELENALNVSFCESLLLGEVAKEMNKFLFYMGPLLRKFYKAYEDYYNNLGNDDNKQRH